MTPPARPRWRAAAAVYLDRRMLAILLLGLSSGLPLALTGATLSLWLKDEGLSLTEIGLFTNVATPYALKFLWAPLMDQVRLPVLAGWLGRRRSWLLATQLSLMVLILALAATDPGEQLVRTALLAFGIAFGSASQDIVVDAYRVEICDEDAQAAGAASIVFGYRVGMLVSGAGALYLASFAGWSWSYAAMAGALLTGVATTLLSREPEVDGVAPAPAVATDRLRRVLRGIAGPFVEFFGRPAWALVLAFALLYRFGDALAGVMAIPFFDDLGFSKLEIANVAKVYGTAATLLGLALGGWLMKSVRMVPALWICGVLQLASNLTFAGLALVGHSLPFLAAAIGVENLTGGMATAAFVAYLSNLTDARFTATQYALLTALTAGARIWLASTGGWLATQLGWFEYFVLTAGAALPGLGLLWLLTGPSSRITLGPRRPA